MEKICISIVSHKQTELVEQLLSDFVKLKMEYINIYITHNTTEKIIQPADYPSLKLNILVNDSVQGFAENHNKVLLANDSDYACVLNPDIRLFIDPFPILLPILKNLKVGVVAPLILNSHGEIEDSARKFPTLWTILKRVLFRQISCDYPNNNQLIKPDWIAGMFMLFRHEIFQKIGGFDERYILYCEDVDICYRLREIDLEPVLYPNTSVIHNAQRASHRNLKYLLLHLRSIFLLLIKFNWKNFKAKNKQI